METTRRRALLATIGLSAMPGCGLLDRSEPSEDGSTEETPSEPPDTPTPGGEDGLKQTIDVLVYERDGQFSAIEGGEVIASHPDDLGRVIDEAQAALSEGYLLVATDGVSRTEIGHEDDIVIGGAGRRTELTPAEDTASSFDLFLTSTGPASGRFESVHIDMQNRGRTAIRSAGFADVVFDDVRIRNTAHNGLTLADGRSADVRNCRFTDIRAEAVRLAHSSNVTVRNCESIGAKYGVYARDASDVVVRGFRSQETRLNGVAIYDYTENWQVIGCRAVDDGHTPFAASPALNGAFINCTAVGTTGDREGGFEIEYKAGHDHDDRAEPVEGCSVVSCTAIECNLGFYAREDDSEETTDTRVIRPRFIDCTAIGCATGLFIDDNVVEAIIREFTPVECTADLVDNGTRTIVDGRSENAGDPAADGQWNGHAQTAAELDVTVEDTENGARYTATETGTWKQIS